MKISHKVLHVGILTLLLSGGSMAQQKIEDPPPPVRVPGPKTEQRISFDQQYEVFKKLGFVINPDIEASMIEQLRSDKSIETKPYAALYMELGRTIQKEPWTPLTNRCWDFDIEAIEDHGAYIEIMKNLKRISRGELKFENLNDYVDVEKGKAWVSFQIKGEKYKWNLHVEDDWADRALFTKLAELTTKMKTKGRYTYFDTGGQNIVIGYETPEKRDEIIKLTGLKIEWQ